MFEERISKRSEKPFVIRRNVSIVKLIFNTKTSINTFRGLLLFVKTDYSETVMPK